MIGGYSGNTGDAMVHHNGMKFTTKDNDNDLKGYGNCATRFTGAWWYNNCFQANLNALYPSPSSTSAEDMSWDSLFDTYGTITYSEMKIKYL